MFKKGLLILFCLSLIAALPVHAKKKAPAPTALEIRQMQTRNYEVKNKKELMEGIVNVLQDRDYLLNESSYNLGVVSGYKECKEGRRYVRYETSVQITELNNNNYKVRTNFIKKNIDQFGAPSTQIDISNPEEFYREFFTQLNKSMFIEAQGI